MVTTADPLVAFKDVDVALLVGARPRGPGMERKDLLLENAKIFTVQGKALNAVASRDVKVLVVGNPANTNAYIAMKSAPDLSPKNFTAMLRLDHNRALSQLAAKTGKAVDSFEKFTVWGNHSPTMYPDYRFATTGGASVAELINDQEWNANTFIPTVGKRGAAIIAARGLSSAASAANAAIDHVHDWVLGSNGKWVTMGVPSDGSYGIPEGVVFGFPVTTENGQYTIIKDLSIDDFSQKYIDITLGELEEERAGVADPRYSGESPCSRGDWAASDFLVFFVGFHGAGAHLGARWCSNRGSPIAHQDALLQGFRAPSDERHPPAPHRQRAAAGRKARRSAIGTGACRGKPRLRGHALAGGLPGCTYRAPAGSGYLGAAAARTRQGDAGGVIHAVRAAAVWASVTKRWCRD